MNNVVAEVIVNGR